MPAESARPRYVYPQCNNIQFARGRDRLRQAAEAHLPHAQAGGRASSIASLSRYGYHGYTPRGVRKKGESFLPHPLFFEGTAVLEMRAHIQSVRFRANS